MTIDEKIATSLLMHCDNPLWIAGIVIANIGGL
jgi:hypothetical protein